VIALDSDYLQHGSRVGLGSRKVLALCLDCQSPISRQSIRCRRCAGKFKKRKNNLLHRALVSLPTKDCVPWEGSLNEDGYGNVSIHYNGECRAHRCVYVEVFGPIPEGLELDHGCRNRACVNPEHLEPVLHVENVRRGSRAEQQKSETHCKNGHEYTEENTGRRKTGHRYCRTCHRANSKKSWLKKKNLLEA
jgi:hypothetical protein